MDNRRLIISVVLCIALLIGWQSFAEYMGWLPEPQPVPAEQQAKPESQISVPAAPARLPSLDI